MSERIAGLSRFWRNLSLRAKGLVVVSIPLVPLLVTLVLEGVLRTRNQRVASAVLGIGFGVGTAVLFTRGISRRIERVKENADRLARGQPLQPLPAANDEVGQLSRRLDEAAALLSSRVQHLVDARQELDRFFSISLDLLCIAGLDGTFRRVNPAWQSVLGWTAEDLLNVPYLDFVHPDDREETTVQSARLAQGEVTIGFENRYRSKDGSYRWLSWKAAQMHGLIYAAARDVTDERRVAEELTAARVEADRANLAKTRFLSAMSHDLRTPLNAILGFAQLLEMDDLGPDRADNVSQILRGGRHLLELITEILDITRIESGQLTLSLEPVNVDEIVQEAVGLIRPLAAQRGIGVHIEALAGDQSAVMADRQRLKQILLNLLSNAVKYNRERGQVTVRSELVNGDRCRIAVTDTGAGISTAKLALLFTPFERIGAEQTSVEGTGLGLALARALAEAMHGSVSVQSAVDRGSTFWVELPVTVRSSVQPKQPPTPAESRTANSAQGTILYVEDNLSNVRLMQRILERRPAVAILHAPGGAAAIEMMDEHRPDLVFLDLHLPDMPGEEVLRRLWEEPRHRQVPVIILTADASPGLTSRLKAAGAAALLTKPLDVPQLLSIVDEWLPAGSND